MPDKITALRAIVTADPMLSGIIAISFPVPVMTTGTSDASDATFEASSFICTGNSMGTLVIGDLTGVAVLPMVGLVGLQHIVVMPLDGEGDVGRTASSTCVAAVAGEIVGNATGVFIVCAAVQTDIPVGLGVVDGADVGMVAAVGAVGTGFIADGDGRAADRAGAVARRRVDDHAAALHAAVSTDHPMVSIVVVHGSGCIPVDDRSVHGGCTADVATGRVAVNVMPVLILGGAAVHALHPVIGGIVRPLVVALSAGGDVLAGVIFVGVVFSGVVLGGIITIVGADGAAADGTDGSVIRGGCVVLGV